MRSAMVSSLNPISLASLRSSGVRPALILFSMAMMLLSFLTKKMSHLARSATSSSDHPLLSASAMTNMRLSVASKSSVLICSSVTSTLSRPLTPISRDLSPFSRASSKVLPMDMTSPVDFIWVPRWRSTVLNLSKGQRGILMTT